MKVLQTELNSAQVINLTGRLDADAAPAVEEFCDQFLTGEARTLVINLGGLDYLSSAGLRALLTAGKKVQRYDRELVLVATAGRVKEILELAGFDRIFRVCSRLEEAVPKSAD